LDDVVRIQETVRAWALQVVVAAYGGDTHRLLTDLGGLVQASIAYVDRPTVEAHLERPVTDDEWSAVVRQFTAMGFDQHVGDADTVRTGWIEDTLRRAGLPGRTAPELSRPDPPRPPVRR
jgi:hypothetical protein